MQGMRGTRGMFTRIRGNLLEYSGECYYFNIPGNVTEDSGECSRRFRGMLAKILEDNKKDWMLYNAIKRLPPRRLPYRKLPPMKILPPDEYSPL